MPRKTKTRKVYVRLFDFKIDNLIMETESSSDEETKVYKRKTKECLLDLREKEYYEKPSAKRNKAKQAAKLREQKRQRDEKKKRTKSY